MVKEANMIEQKSYASLVYGLCKTFSFGTATFIIYNISGRDSYISVIISMLIGLLPFMCFLVLRKLCGNGNIYDLNIDTFGKMFGNILNFIINFTLIALAIILIYNIGIFFNLLYMPDTTLKYLLILVMLPIVYAATKDLPTISRVAQIMMILTIFVYFVSAIGLLESIKIDNIFPILSKGIKPPLKSGLVFAIFTVMPIFLALIVEGKYIKVNKKFNKTMFLIYIFSILMEFILVFFTIITLGEEVIQIYRYPEYIALKNFSLFDIIERVENALSLHFLYNMCIFLVLTFYSFKTSINRIVKQTKWERYYVYILAIAIYFIIGIIFKNTIQATNILQKYSIYLLLFGIGVPMLISLIRCINKKNDNKIYYI